MNPVFCPVQGELDLARLRLVFENGLDEALVTAIKNGIEDWVAVDRGNLGVSIVKLNLKRTTAATGDYIIYVGNGSAGDTKAREPERTLQISHVVATHGYLFSTESDLRRTAAHEFGHLLGLADRYYEGYSHKKHEVGNRLNVPMDSQLFPQEQDYVPSTNLMSGGASAWTLSEAQRKLVLACKSETQKSRRVAGLFDQNQSEGSWHLPSTMYLSGDALMTPNGPPPPDLAIAGYMLVGGLVFMAKAGKTKLKNEPVRELWNLRPPPKKGAERKTWFRKGKRHKSRRMVSTAPRIHREMMRHIGQLAGP